MKKIFILFVVVLCLSLFACQPAVSVPQEDTEPENKPTELHTSTVNLMNGVTAREIDVSSFSEIDTDAIDFCFDLFSNGFESKNTLLSPLSVLYALAMTANGADGRTKEQMEAVLGGDTESLNKLLYAYSKSLGDDAVMKLANAIWFKRGSEDFTADRDFLQTNADYYGAGLFEAPFDDDTLADINGWVSDKTNHKINNILDRINQDAVMYLVNALYFSAKWSKPYTESSVREDDFFPIDGEAKKMDMMRSTEHVYFEDENCTGVMKYYEGNRFAFAAFLPEKETDFNSFISGFTAQKFKNLYQNRISCTVHTAIPKFQTEYSTEMSELLIKMGMEDAFNPLLADFTKLGKVPEGETIYINRVLHKTFIDVNESGTEAAGATVVEMNKATSAAPTQETKTVTLNRPFVYMILDTETNLPVFIGSFLG